MTDHCGTGKNVARSCVMHLSRIALIAALVAAAPPALAQKAPAIPGLGPSPSATSSGPQISAELPANDDARIAARIRGIFSEIGALRPVQVRVSAGVVTLTGTVADAGAIAQAEGIATRVAGVVTVQNRLQRNLAVENNLNPALSGVKAKAMELVQALPLVAVGLVIAMLICWFGYFLARRKTWWGRVAPNPFLAEVIATAIRLVFVVAGIVLGLEIIGATALLSAVLGGAGVIGIAIGFAVRDTIDNYVSSLMLSLRQPFRANDSVSIDGKEGRVARLTSRATILITPDGNHLRIPNSTVFRAVIVNFTTNPHRRFQFDLPVDTRADCADAIRIALAAMKGQDFVLAVPRPAVEIADAAGPNLVIRCMGWVDQTRTDLAKARTATIQQVTRALREAGLAVADPVHRIRMEGMEGEGEGGGHGAAAPPPVPPAESTDLAPKDHVATMVEEERATKKDGKDLLDPGRPVE